MNSSAFQRRFIKQVVLVWLNLTFNETTNDDHNVIAQLEHIVKAIFVFTDVDECVNFCTEIHNEIVVLILTDDFNQELIPLIHDIPQLQSIYLLCHVETHHETSITSWSKMKGLFSRMELLCHRFKQDIFQYKNDMISISVLSSIDTSNRDLNQLDPSFMYSQLLKEILLEIKYNSNAKNEFADYCREHLNITDLNMINKFEQEYEQRSPIWWYTLGSFIYSTINQALRVQDIETTIKMAFLMHDIHRQIEQLHAQMSNNRDSFTVYRGQGLLKSEFETMHQNIGGLLSFNSFLSTSTDPEVGKFYAECSHANDQLIAVLFHITIQPTMCSIPYASLNEISNFGDSEDEILFSMHTVFRIDEMKQLVDDRFWEVKLILTSDHDEDLKRLTQHIRGEVASGTGWYRLANLMLKMGKYSKAQEVCKTLIDSTPKNDWVQLSVVYNTLAQSSQERGDFSTALLFYQNSLELDQKLAPFIPAASTGMAITYNNIGEAHRRMGNNLSALSYYQKTCDLLEISEPFDYISFGTVYGNIGQVFASMGKYSTALAFFNKALIMKETKLPSNHSDFAIIYNNIGTTYRSMGNLSKALSFYQKTLDVEKRSLTSDHSSLAITYNNIGEIYQMKEDYTLALSFYQKSNSIVENSLLENHPLRATIYINMGIVYQLNEDYSKAHEFFQKALPIFKQTYPSNHPHLVTLYNHIGASYLSMENHSNAEYFFRKAIAIGEKCFALNKHSLSSAHFHMAQLLFSKGQYRSASGYAQRAVEIGHQIVDLPDNSMKKYQFVLDRSQSMMQRYLHSS